MAEYTQPGPIYKALLPSPFQIIALGERAKQAEEDRKIKQMAQIRDENSKALDKAFNYQANPLISQYQGYFDKAAKDVYSLAKPLYYTKDPAAKEALSSKMNETDGELNIVKDMEQQINNVRQTAGANKDRFNQEWVNNNLYSTIYNEDGTLKHPKQLDPQQPYSLLNNHQAYNIAGINADFAKGVDEDITNEFKLVSKGGMKFMDKVKKVSKFAKLDADGNPQYDKETGRLQLNVTPELMNKYLSDQGGRLWAEELVKEKQAAGQKDYGLKNAVEDLLSSSGYAKKGVDARTVLDRNTMDINFIGGSGESDQRHRAAADYFYNLIHGDEAKKKSLLGDISSGKDFAAKYEKAPVSKAGEPPIEPSKSGYVVIDYDPLSKFGSFMDKLMESSMKDAQASLDMSDDEIKAFKERAREDHKIMVNLDDEEGAWRELNYWRNLSRNQDINSDYLKQAYDELKAKKEKGVKFDMTPKNTPKQKLKI